MAKYFKVTLACDPGGNYFVMKDTDAIGDLHDMCGPGAINIDVVNLTDEEFAALPDFNGF